MICYSSFPELCGLSIELNSDPSTCSLGRVRERVQFAYNKRALQLQCRIAL